MTERPETKYARAGDVHVAYQVFGSGPPDIVFSNGFVSHLELNWDIPAYVAFMERMVSFCRMIVYDRRGCGMSDPVDGTPDTDERIDDISAVIDATRSRRPFVFGSSEAGALALLYGATYPDRVSGMILFSTYPRLLRAADYPAGMPREVAERGLEAMAETWTDPGTRRDFLVNPSLSDDPVNIAGIARMRRAAMTPAMVRAHGIWTRHMDIRSVLGTVQVPTLIMHRRDESWIRIDNSRYMAERIPGARFVELEGCDHWPWIGDTEAVVAEVQEFVTGERPALVSDRVLATVLFTDLVGHTEKMAEVGDERWRQIIDRHDAIARAEVERHRGRLVATAGDEIVATFEGPARGIRCAQAITRAVQPLGVKIRAGLHTGEITLRGDDISGIAVNTASRVMSVAGPDEVLVSRTVADLVAGSGLEFADRGSHALKGLPGEWQLFEVVS